MKTSRSFRRLYWLLVLGFISPLPSRAHPAAEDMANAANHFLAALSAEQKAKATFDLGSDERFNWHFIPKTRNGLPFKDLTPAQTKLAHALLGSGLSQRGYMKATTIMSLEEILRDQEKGKGPVRDPDLYFISIFGKPSATGTWGWRVEGHHLAINFTVVKGELMATTPSFLGSNPAEVKEGPRKGLRVLAAEEDLGRHLVKSLNAEQSKAAIFTIPTPKDIITGADRKAKPLEPSGLAATAITPAACPLSVQVGLP